MLISDPTHLLVALKILYFLSLPRDVFLLIFCFLSFISPPPRGRSLDRRQILSCSICTVTRIFEFQSEIWELHLPENWGPKSGNFDDFLT